MRRMSIRDRSRRTSTYRLGQARWLGLVIALGLFTSGCATALPVARSVYESPDTIVRLEPSARIEAAAGVDHDHPTPLIEDQVAILLTSISGRNKVGLLRSFFGTPGTPRLFEPKEIEAMAAPLKEALQQARPDEVITFSFERAGREGQSAVTSGTLFVQQEILYVTLANFWHPVARHQSDVGATDKLDDVRETREYVRAHPWISVGEQDFAIFFDDPQYQRQGRRGELFGYPERTLGIAYRPFLASNPDLAARVEEVTQSSQQERFAQDEAKVIADLQRRIAELERSKEALKSQLKQSELSPPLRAPVESNKAVSQETNRTLLEVIQRLEERLATLEKAFKKKPPAAPRRTTPSR
ncbi:MAG: hypothetical protein H0V35_10640 [Nitrospira sp.]|nr:hypothetical protein [Nitrospira sp.]